VGFVRRRIRTRPIEGGESAHYSESAAPRLPGRARRSANVEEAIMLHYAVVFFVIALVAAVLGFGGIAAGAAEIAKILFVVFLVMAVVSFVLSLLRGRR
jgi:uncharacterized membrane protein YtjA (UPF0391 family)